MSRPVMLARDKSIGRHRRLIVVVATAAGFLAACGTGPLSSTDLAGLDGTWTGTSRLLDGTTQACAERIGVRVVIANAAVEGEAWNAARPALPARFQAFVETDGGMFTDIYLGGDRLRLTGKFSRNSFSGTYRSRRNCFGRLTLSRATT